MTTALVVLSAVASVAAVAGTGTAAASGGLASGDATTGHGTEHGNYTVDLPFATDHYPRDENPGGPYNASINHYSAFTKEIFQKQGVKAVEEMDYIVVSNPDIDFSQCSTSNTAAFGIDRDNDDPGTETDINLLDYRENSVFRKHKIIVRFFDGGELAAKDPPDRGGYGEGKGEGREDGDGNPEVYPDDEIVSHQGYKSGGGPCYGMPKEPGWYQIQGYGNGTAFNGQRVETHLPSHYFWICVCQNEQEAREKLGPPPSERDEATATPTPTATPEDDENQGGTGGGSSTATPVDSTPTPTSADGSTPTPTAGQQDAQGGTATPTPTASGGGSGGNSSGSGAGSGGGGGSGGGDGSGGANTPTPGDGPGLGAVAALVALAAAAGLAVRRA